MAVSIADLFLLREQWLPTVLRHMVWLQQDLDTMRAEARKRFRKTRLGRCYYCDKMIKCDMYRYVSTYHFDWAQLWRCPVSWCTVWKGTPQDCMDHVRGAHNVPWDVKSTSLEKSPPPPLTVRRQVWTESLLAGHSGISTDILLLSDIHLSLTHHYRVHRRGLPHSAFRRDYLARLRGFVTRPAGQSRRDTGSPVASSPVLSPGARSVARDSEDSQISWTWPSSDAANSIQFSIQFIQKQMTEVPRVLYVTLQK